MLYATERKRKSLNRRIKTILMAADPIAGNEAVTLTADMRVRSDAKDRERTSDAQRRIAAPWTSQCRGPNLEINRSLARGESQASSGCVLE